MAVFSDTSGNLGIVQQVRSLMRVDSTQWPTYKIVNSCNNYLDLITGYAIGADSRFQWDDTNHTALPEGTTNLVASQSDYSFLTDQQGNTILTLTRLEVSDGSNWHQLKPLDHSEVDDALANFESTDGTPVYYDKIADNIVRLYPTPSTSVTSGLKLYFQRTPSYFTASDTTKAPGVAPLLHRGFVIAAAYDGAMTLGLPNFNLLAAEKQLEEQKMITYFSDRNKDEVRRIKPLAEDNH